MLECHMNKIFVLSCFTSGMLFSAEFRVVQCDKSNLILQSKILEEDKSLSKELKLKLELKEEIDGCRLLGLDDTVKASSQNTFAIESLESLINSMPMRQAQLQRRSD